MTEDHPKDSVTVTEDGVEINAPKYKDSPLKLLLEDSPEPLAPHIDFFYGRPTIYIYTYNQEEPKHIILLPTNDDPYARTLKNGAWENDELYEKLRNDEPIH